MNKTLQILVAIVLNYPALPALAEGPFDGAWFSDTATELHLVQDGLTVTGTWNDASKSGSLKGTVLGDTLKVYFCSYSAGENTPDVCPNYSTQFDYLTIHGSHLAWYKHAQAGFDTYRTLERRVAAAQAK